MSPSSSRVSIALVINVKAAAASAMGLDAMEEKIAHALAPLGTLTAFAAVEPHAFPATVAAFCDKADVIVIGGGDGSISSVAPFFVGTKKTLGILPLGTFNLLARSLNIPLGLDAALTTLARAKPRRIDVGVMVDGAGHEKFFLHHASIGFHPRFIRLRDALPYASRAQKIWVSIKAWLRNFYSLRRIKLAIEGDVDRLPMRYYQVGVTIGAPGAPPGTTTEESQEKGLRLLLVPAHGRFGFIGAAMLAFLGRWRSTPLLQVAAADHLSFSGKKDFLVSCDGEVARHPAPLSFSLRKEALSVLCADQAP